MLLRISLLLLLLHQRKVHGIGCGPGQTSTYLRSEGLRLMEFARETLKDHTLNACSRACTDNEKGVQCESFEYDPRVQECSLHPVSGQPFGHSVLAKTEKERAFFQQICLPSTGVCPTPYSFERIPQHILFGHSLEVVVVEGGLSECLGLCLDASSRFGIQCRSIMFYYQSNECILNRETRSTVPKLFTPVVKEGTIVDYLENNCHDVACPSSSSLHWLRSEEFAIGHDKDVIIESMNQAECKRLCIDNGVAGEAFPCKAFVFSTSKEECHLSAESGLKKEKGAFDLSPISSGEYSEKMCLRSPYQCKEGSFEVVPGRRLVNATVKVIETSNVNICLESCLNEQDSCSAATFNYELDECYLHSESQYTSPSNFQRAPLVDYFDKICDYLPQTLSIPLPSATTTSQEAEDPSSIPSDPFPTLTPPHVEGVATHGTPFPSAPPPPPPTSPPIVENSVDEESSSPSSPPSNADLARSYKPQKDDHREVVEGASVEEPLGVFAANPEKVKARMTTECRLSGISLIVDFDSPTSGALFVQEAFGTCKVLFTESESATLHIPFPKSDEPSPKCPGEEITPGFWSFIIVVQKNDLNAPSLMTSNDRIFNVTCDYSAVQDEALFLQPEEESTESSSVSSEQGPKGRVRMAILKDEVPISNIGLGEEMELRWTIKNDTADDSTKLGFFINECIAERIGGSPPEPEPLKLIFNGCPEENVRNRLMRYPVVRTSDGFSTKMKVFRFDGSRKVRIRCTVDVCVEQCPPVLCESIGEDGTTSDVQSFGRKRRDTNLERMGKMLRRMRPVFGKRDQQKEAVRKKERRPRPLRSVTRGTITIVDRVALPLPSDLIRGGGSPEPLSTSPSGPSLCLSRPHLFTAIAVASVLAIGQLFVLLNCARRRCGGGSSAHSECSGGTSYTGATSAYLASSIASGASRESSVSFPSPDQLHKFGRKVARLPDTSPIIHEYETPREPAPPPHRRWTLKGVGGKVPSGGSSNPWEVSSSPSSSSSSTASQIHR